MEEILLSTTILAAFLGGMVALFAPCCVSVMLPAFFATTFRRKTEILGMTLVFAAGVGTIILPIAFGAAALSRLLIEYHTPIFAVGGSAMIVMGALILAGRKIMLPMLVRGGSGGGRNIRSVYTLGAFSGAASACCAPVLAGVAAISGAASSFPAALAVGVAYVSGMVAPLCAMALAWDRHRIGQRKFLTGRTLPLWPKSSYRVPVATFLSGMLMLVMGALTIALAIRGPGMATDGWEVRFSAALTHFVSNVQELLAFVPGWTTTLLIFGALVSLIVLAIRRRNSTIVAESPLDDPPATEPAAGQSDATPGPGDGSVPQEPEAYRIVTGKESL
ncbi:Cytochrome c biogenesis protein CcdA [Arthrobacter subterraneus]|uniref:Cytochrome c biogenesis protein CcdA n=1 Tax=Arthrobacter subterraneus TaxID=335973 RepID=A0A1G8PSD5_9MICC|nr:cytochrome c biogenesis protein CcdA [Arthrobacter subterraneus]SDI95459.1 Cytochrome c biogenesis protein CcdA [Arthrobacter subterraneus]